MEVPHKKKVAVVENLRLKFAENGASSLLQKMFNPYNRYDVSLRTYHPNQKKIGLPRELYIAFWYCHFHQQVYGSGKFGNAAYPTHKNLARQFFFKSLVPSKTVHNDSGYLDLPEIMNGYEVRGTSADANDKPNRRKSIPQLIGTVDMKPVFNSSASFVNNSDHGVVNSKTIINSSADQLVLTTMARIVRTKGLNKNESILMEDIIRDNADYMFKNIVIMRVPNSTLDPNCEIKPLKWLSQIRTNQEESSDVWYRARLVSASNIYYLRNSIAGNAPTIAIRSILLFLAIASTWNSKIQEKRDRFAIRVRDVTKSYLQCDLTERSIFYRVSIEANEDDSVAQKAIRHIYGGVLADRNQGNTFILWLYKYILDEKPSI